MGGKKLIQCAFPIVIIMVFVSSMTMWSPTIVERKMDIFPFHLIYHLVVEISSFWMIPLSTFFSWMSYIHYCLIILAITMLIISFCKNWDIAENAAHEEPNKKNE